MYFGETAREDVIQTDEGELFWIAESELMNREYTKMFTAMLEHYLERDKNDSTVYIGAKDEGNGGFIMRWLPL